MNQRDEIDHAELRDQSENNDLTDYDKGVLVTEQINKIERELSALREMLAAHANH